MTVPVTEYGTAEDEPELPDNEPVPVPVPDPDVDEENA